MTDARQSAPRTATPWIVAAVLGAVAIALAGVIVFVIHPQREHRQKLARQSGLTAAQTQAMATATTEALNLTTYSRKTFNADYQRSIALSTGGLKTDLTNAQKKSALLSEMNAGKFDLQGQVLNTAFEQQSGNTYGVLVVVSGFQVPDGGTKVQNSHNRWELSVQLVGKQWLVSGVQNVGLI
jgi:hypothetical protein